jgi:hypothetical protein
MDNVLDASQDNSFGRMAIDKKRNKMDGDKSRRLVGFNESINSFKKITFGPADTETCPFQT